MVKHRAKGLILLSCDIFLWEFRSEVGGVKVLYIISRPSFGTGSAWLLPSDVSERVQGVDMFSTGPCPDLSVHSTSALSLSEKKLPSVHIADRLECMSKVPSSAQHFAPIKSTLSRRTSVRTGIPFRERAASY